MCYGEYILYFKIILILKIALALDPSKVYRKRVTLELCEARKRKKLCGLRITG